MPILLQPDNKETQLLLKKFNKRDGVAFGEVYSLIYKELYYFSYRLFNQTTIDPKDVIQDAFMKIWDENSVEFESIKKLKSYLYTSINNSFRMHYKHSKVITNSVLQLRYDDNLKTIYAAEAEIFSIIPHALRMLPKDCAESFALFIEGYSVKEIAEKIGKPTTTIYSQREKAISILKKKLTKDQLLFIMGIIIK